MKSSGNLTVFSCLATRPRVVSQPMQCSITAASPSARPSLIEPSGDMMEKYESMIAEGTLKICEGWLIEVQVANLLSPLILNRKIWLLGTHSRLQLHCVPSEAKARF